MPTSKRNKVNIQKNRRAIFEVEAAVMSNKTKAYASRSSIEENRAGILKNYTAVFLGNRQLVNKNTDDVFRHRKAILSALEPTSEVEQNFKESMINLATLDFLEHRSQLNASVLSVNEKMVIVNQLLIEINDTIMKANDGIVKYNNNQLSQNNKILEDELAMKKATPVKNAERVEKNAARSKTIKYTSIANSKKVDAITKSMKSNRLRIDKKAAEINKRRDRILRDAASIKKNQTKIARRISS